MNRNVMKAFDAGGLPVIKCVNRSATPWKAWNAGKSFEQLIASLQSWARIFLQFWGLDCRLEVANALSPGAWGMVFSDEADVAHALGYHTTTPDGYPLMHNFVRPSILANLPISIAASHELGEALADPCLNLCAIGPGDLIYAYEVCDAVQSTRFKVGGLPMSNFVFPAWFERFKRAKYDYLGQCSKPYQILAGGYMPVYRRGKWEQIYGQELPGRLHLSPLRRALRRGVNPTASQAVTWDPEAPGPRAGVA